ncbi:MAG: hypothetical protein V4857_05775 [Pseudomonadota bacterium]
MEETTAQRFSTHLEFEEQFQLCIARSNSVLQLFDPDFAVFPLGSTETDAALRAFLAAGGSVQLAMHRSAHIEKHYPRFQRLLRDYSHKVECRVTSRSLHQLTDSFCIGDRVNIVRRFHCDHMRGEADFNAPMSTEISLERFAGIWVESLPGLHPTTTGL